VHIAGVVVIAVNSIRLAGGTTNRSPAAEEPSAEEPAAKIQEPFARPQLTPLQPV